MNVIEYFEIQAGDPARAMDFYGRVFGWKFHRLDFVPLEYYRIEGAGVEGGLLKRQSPPPPAGCSTNAFCCTMQVADIGRAEEQILALGGRLALPRFAIPGKCWQEYFYDPEGNWFGVFQADRHAG